MRKARRRTPTNPATLGFAPMPLECQGRRVATYQPGDELRTALSPRPYLHPVHTFAGTRVTEMMPADHAHHLGVSVAVADVSGANFWGGRTFVRDQGPTWLDNHGRQRHLRWIARSPSSLVQELSWTAANGRELLRERRSIWSAALGVEGWALNFTMSLRNTCERQLVFGSPATNGRPNAGYGGFFWRAPVDDRPPRCLGPGGEGEEELHGSRAEWLAMSGTTGRRAAWTLVFLAPPGARDPWFVRAREYPGVGSSLAWDTPLPLEPGAELRRHLVTLVVDGSLDRAEITELVDRARSQPPAPSAEPSNGS